MSFLAKYNPDELRFPAIIFRNEDYAIQFASSDAVNLYGFQSGEMCQLNLMQLFHHPIDSVSGEDWPHFERDVNFKGHFSHYTKDGEVIQVSIVPVPIEYCGERCTMLIIDHIISDIISEGSGLPSGEKGGLNEKVPAKLEGLFTDFRFLLNSSPDLIFRISKDGFYLEVYPENSPKLAVPADQIIGKNITEILPLEISRITVESLRECFDTNSESRCEYQLALPSGIHYFESRNKPVNSQEAICIIRDITDFKRSEREMMIFQNRLKLAQEMALIAYWDYMPNEGIIVFSDFMSSILGLDNSCKSLTLQEFVKLAHPEFSSKLDKAFRDHLTNHIPFGLEYKIIVDGREKWFYVSAITNFADQENPTVTTGILQDITERMDLKFQFENQGALFSSMLNTLPDVFFYKDLEGKFRGINSKFEEITGLSSLSVIGRSDHELFDSEYADIFVENDRLVFEKGKPILAEEVHTSADGKLHVYESLKAPIFSDKGDLMGLIGFSRMIDDRLELEHKIREQTDTLVAITENVPGILVKAMYTIDDDLSVLYASSGFYNLFPVSTEDIYTNMESVLQYIIPEDRQNLLSSIREHSELMKNLITEIRIQDDMKDDYRYVSVHAKPSLVEPRKYIWHGYLSEITEQKRLSEELLKKEFLLNNLLDTMEDVVYVIDAESYQVLNMSPSATKLYGRQTYEFYDDPELFIKIAHPDDRKYLEEMLISLLQEKRVELQYRILLPDGSIKWVLDKFWLSYDPNNQKSIIQGLIIDITKIKSLEADINHHAEFLKLLLNLANSFINIPVIHVDQSINAALETVGLFVGADRSYIFTYDFKKYDCSNTFEWCAEGISPEIDNLQNVPLGAIPHWVDMHMKKEAMIIADVFSLPPEDGVRQILEPQGVKSIITLPIFDRGVLTGFIGFDSVNQYKVYTDREVQLLQFLSEIIINAQNRKMFEQNLIKSRKRFQSIYYNASLGLYRIDGKGKLLMVNPAMAEILGFEGPLELEGRYIAEMNIVDIEALLTVRKKLKINDLVTGYEGTWRKKNGEPIFIRESVRVIRDKNGNPIYYDGAAEDITQRKNAEMALLESEEKFRQLAENISDMIWLRDLIKDEVIYFNPSLAKFFGQREEINKCNIRCFLDQCNEEERDRLSEFLTLEVSQEKHGDFILMDMNHNQKWFKIDIYPIKSIDGDVIRQVGIATDISTMIEAQEALKKSLEIEKKVGELKTRFVSMASHEFKTPLASIIMASETIQNFRSRFTDQDYDKYLDRIKRNTVHLSAMINNVLNLSKMESGNIQITPERIAVNEFIGKWLSGYQENHPVNHKIFLELPENETYVNVDRQHLLHAMDNLFSNGMKYSPRNSEIEIGVRTHSGYLTISVSDHGIGIPEKDRNTMFSPFFRASNSGSVHGTGLGLSMVKQMVEQNGGKIWFESREGEGTVFYVEFPLCDSK